MAAYILLALMTLLFILNAAIRLPISKPIDLTRGKAGDFVPHPGSWYILDEESYTPGPELGAITMHSSFLPFFVSKYTYYCVTVNPGGENTFSMPVRVRAGKRQKLENGEAVTLYGMASELTGDLRSRLENAASGQSEWLSYLCLNDNGDTAAARRLSSAVFAMLACLCIFLMIKLARR